MKNIIGLLILISFINCCSLKEVDQEVIGDSIPIEQVSINSFPKSNQLYTRDTNNKAKIFITGIAEKTVDSLIIKIHRNNGVITRTAYKSHENFSFNVEIDALLHNYTIELFSKEKEQETLIKKATKVVAGDVYVLNGQSNAWAIDYDNKYNSQDLPESAKWVRTIGAMHVYSSEAIYPEVENTDWFQASGKAPDIRKGDQLVGNGMVGVLGMRLGINLVESENVPIAIINGAGGGGAISFYQKSSNNDLNVPYGRLQHRLEASGLKDRIKAFVWNQGENNAGDSVLEYKNALNDLYSSFKSDFSFEKFYVIQTPPGCNSASGHQTVREAQRQFVEENENVGILTRHGISPNPNQSNGNNFLSDGCHYHAHGYEVLADWISSLARFDFYEGTVDYQAPKPIRVYSESTSSIIIEFDKEITIQPDLEVDGAVYTAKDNLFTINDARLSSISSLEILQTNPKKIRLIISEKNIIKGDNLTYILKDNYFSTSTAYRGPWIVDAVTGVGAVGFTKDIE